MVRHGLPIVVRTFRENREESLYHVDRMSRISRLVGEGRHDFLSRPRRCDGGGGLAWSLAWLA